MGFADLHIHSIYSDGTLSPAEIIRDARARNVELISICDHNEVRGTLEGEKLARAAGVSYITGVEIDALYENLDMHILCYGADLRDAELSGRIRKARERLDKMSVTLLARMAADGHDVSMEEYASFPFDSRKGGWKMLQYLVKKGIAGDLYGAMPFYERYDVHYAGAGFDSAAEVISAIHNAGGRAVLAHPGVLFPTESLNEFAAHVEAALDLGLDGVECYYHRHEAGLTRRLVEICKSRGAMITAGSDCHGAFNRRAVGETKTPISAIDLRGLKFS